MTVSFDADSRRLRLDQPAFDRLVSFASGDTTSDPELTELRQAGVIAQDAAHPAIASGLQAVTDYVCQLRIDLIDDAGDEKSGDGWVSRAGAALLLDVPGGAGRDLLTLDPTLLPAAIARVVRLGPHPLPGSEPLHLTRDVFENLLGDEPEQRRDASERLALNASEPPLPALVNRLVAGPWRRWTATMAWYTPQGVPASETLQVLDTDTCLCVCEAAGANVTLWPTNATGVWRRLTLLLPDEVEGG